MRGKRRGSKRVRKTEHPCELGWRVKWSKDFRLVAKKLGLWKDVRMELRDIERRLRSNFRETIRWLRSHPKVFYTVHKGRKYYVRRVKIGRFRLGYVIREDICRVWFVALKVRTSTTYKHRRL